MSLQTVRGFKDVLPPDSERAAALEALARETLGAHGYRELRLPTVEAQELFVKATGETTDIVEKEMFVLTDAGGRNLALRPEGTPGAVRAFLQHSLQQQGGRTKLFYIGSMFRAERPQAGRFREFEQIGAEYFGNAHPAADVDAILGLAALLDRAGLKGRYTAHVNNLGHEAPDCRPAYRAALLEFLRSIRSELCENCQRRIERNPLRALDCKGDGPRLRENPRTPRLKPCAACAAHFDAVLALLAEAAPELRPEVDPQLVRGLDYYTRTVFELRSSALGSQDAIAGGGRYDGLVRSMGGPDTPAVGWALGAERTLMALKALDAAGPARRGVYVAVQSTEPRLERAAIALLTKLRAALGPGAFAEGGFGLSLKAQLREADRLGASYAVIFGEEELRAGKCAVRDLKGGHEQWQATPEEALKQVRERLEGRR